MTTDHQRAKELLCAYLNGNKGDVTVDHVCTQCIGTVVSRKFPTASAVLQYKCDTRDDNYTWNIAAVNMQTNKVVLGVEISCSANTKRRVGVPWYDLWVNDVIRQLDVSFAAPSCQFVDLQKFPICSSPGCMPLKMLAVELGYLVVEKDRLYACKAREVLDDVTKGSHLTSLSWWRPVAHNPDRTLWNSFLRRGVCLMCGFTAITEKWLPYCMDCYGAFMDAPAIVVDEMWGPPVITSKQSDPQWIALGNWLLDMLGGWTSGTSCSVCKRSEDDLNLVDRYWEPNSTYQKGYVEWYGDKKRCCTQCLEAKMMELGLI